MNPRFLPLILTWLIILGIQICLCQNEYQTCNQRFQCGRFGRIDYPFYGGNRPLSCGYPGFELINCQGPGDPLLNISSMMYRVLDINPSAGTLRVARNDLLENTCPSSPSNTTLDFTRFDYDSSANDQNITLYYSCTLTSPWPPFLAPNYRLDCNGNSLNFFATREVSEQLNSFGNPCRSHIYVPVNQNSAGNLGNVATASMDALRSGLESGFRIQYLADNQNCNNCVDRGGLCGYNQTSTSLACYTSPNGNGNGNGSKKLVITGVSVGIAGLVILCIIIYCITKKCRVHHESNQNVDKFLLNHGSLTPKRYSYHEIRKMTKSFTDKIGKGGYGIVYKGILPDAQLVAVKVLTETSNEAEDFINEVASISRTSHVNIVNLLGFLLNMLLIHISHQRNFS